MAVDADLRETAPLERTRRRWPVVAGTVVVLAVVGVLAGNAFRSSVVYYLSPTEVLSRSGEELRVSGTVVPGSIEFDVRAGIVSFEVTDGRETVLVKFEGPAPDTLKDEAEAVAEGELQADGTFLATKIFAKCPSKFEAK
jgi:cytochrome c-type biogenesis protein CcmE